MAAPQGEAQNTPSLPWKVDHIQSKLTPASAINKAPQKFAGNHGLTRGKLKGDGAQGRFSSDMQECKVDWFASLIKRARSPMERLKLNDLVFRKKRQSQPVLHLVLLDTSASVSKQQSFSQAKSLVSALANQAYLAREQMTLMGFGNQQVTTLLPKKRAPKSLLRLLDSTPAVGGTPLREMVQSAYRYQQQQLAQMPELKLQTYLITDGRTTQSVADLSLLGQVTVIDTEQGQVKRGKANQISRALFAECFSLEELSLSFSHTLKA
jgi:magnesium chelatase subunit D